MIRKQSSFLIPYAIVTFASSRNNGHGFLSFSFIVVLLLFISSFSIMHCLLSTYWLFSFPSFRVSFLLSFSFPSARQAVNATNSTPFQEHCQPGPDRISRLPFAAASPSPGLCFASNTYNTPGWSLGPYFVLPTPSARRNCLMPFFFAFVQYFFPISHTAARAEMGNWQKEKGMRDCVKRHFFSSLFAHAIV